MVAERNVLAWFVLHDLAVVKVVFVERFRRVSRLPFADDAAAKGARRHRESFASAIRTMATSGEI